MKKYGGKFVFRPSGFAVCMAVTGVLAVVSWIYLVEFEKADMGSVFQRDNIEHGMRFIQRLAGSEENLPAFMDKAKWMELAVPFFDTLKMSVMAIGISSLGMLLTVSVAARNIAQGRVSLEKKPYMKPLNILVRASYIVSRAVPELVWAMVLVLVLKPGIIPGALALALHNYGIVSKLSAEAIEDIDVRPANSLALSGAGTLQIMAYYIFPSVMPRLLTYVIYRWEVIIRSTLVVGFIGAGGLGMNFKLAMSYFRYSEITLILILYFLLVTATDIISEAARKIANS